uniref:Dynein axonemal intermediate chain 4 n=1 Tax=Mucochytrium quahogii TaxID=96639 RepID=A0A7S2RSJ4_9STRA|mmetsp:Transcript_22531/g.35910  ORF Transcript_22531/g.35910 Transcript_22531/m.35910 type:complete len:952 (-) Transcript_22531:51-2906(-)
MGGSELTNSGSVKGMRSGKLGQSSLGNSSSGVNKKYMTKKKRVNAGSVANNSMFSSRISGSSVKGGTNTIRGNSRKNARRVIVDGEDLTPLSLIDESESLALPQTADKSSAGSSKNGNISKIDQNAAGGAFASSKGLDAFTSSKIVGNPIYENGDGVDGQDNGTDSRVFTTSEESPQGKSTITEKETAPVAPNGAFQAKSSRDASKAKQLTQDHLREIVTISLEESPTQTLFSLVGVCVGVESVEHRMVTEQNATYEKLCASREGSDLFLSRPSQTMNEGVKNVEVSTGAPPVQDVGCQVTSWDIHDTVSRVLDEEGILEKTKGLDNGSDDEEEGKTDGKSIRKSRNSVGATMAALRENEAEKMVANCVVSSGCLLPVSQSTQTSDNVSEGAPQHLNLDQAEEVSILKSESLLESLRTAERGVQQNVFHQKHLLYRAIPAADDDALDIDDASAIDGGVSEINGNDLEDNALGQEDTENAEEVADGEETKATEGEVDAKDDSTNATPSPANEQGGEGATTGEEGDVEVVAADTQVEAPVVEEEPELQLLWKFQCKEARGRTVSGMSWNKANQDLLAVSYCQFQFSDQRDGLILFWTLKNPEYPERIIKCESGVCSVDFSTVHPSLLAAGMYDGTVAIYDVHHEGDKGTVPVLDSSRMSTQHKDAVWQVKWVNKNEKGEVLVSLSTDGRVTEWSLKKGLESTDLMVLKRVNVPAHLGGGGEGIISRTAAGLSLDFPVNNSGLYYAATEDGTIHRCSCSYNEQYLETYYGHSGPVYKLRCSPFWPDAFLTCSADWSIKLWEPERDEPLLHFQSVDLADVVHDIAWSTSESTVFGSVAGDGRIEIWDLSKSTLDPVITHFIDKDTEQKLERKPSLSAVDPPLPPEARRSSVDDKIDTSKQFFSSISFAYNAPIVVVGSSQGVVEVFRFRGLNRILYETDEEAAEILQHIVEQNQK